MTTANTTWHLFVDVTRCNGCMNCFLAVKDEYVGNAEPAYFAAQPLKDANWMTVEHVETGDAPFTQVTYVPRMCQHCDDAPCMKAATGGAVTKRADGIVLIDPAKATGQRAIAEACPYGAVYWNEDLDLPQVWPFDAHLLDRGWKEPRVAQACPTGAITSAKLDAAALSAKCAAEGWEDLDARAATRPHVHYRGLDRVNKVFVAGTLERTSDGVPDCLEGATVEVSANGTVLGSALSDDMGDFRVTGLTPAETATLTVRVGDRVLHETAVSLSRSLGLDVIRTGA